MRLSEPEDGDQGLVDAPLLFRGHPAHEVTEPPSVHGSNLFNKDVPITRDPWYGEWNYTISAPSVLA